MLFVEHQKRDRRYIGPLTCRRLRSSDHLTVLLKITKKGILSIGPMHVLEPSKEWHLAICRWIAVIPMKC
jgi:hypothetical protein